MNDATPFIDPELVAAQQLLKSKGLVAVSPVTNPIAEARAATNRISAFLNEGSGPLARERDIAVPGPHGTIPCRLYIPDGSERPPVLVYAHGGSFAVGNIDGWDGAMRELARQSGVAVLSVDYRLAPEHRFPVASDPSGKVGASYCVAASAGRPGMKDVRGVAIDHGFLARTTFVLDKDGKVVAAFSSEADHLTPPEHVKKALETVQQLDHK